MYLPKAHEETRTEVLHNLIQAHPLGCLVTLGKDGLVANHIPFLVDPEASKLGVLRGHVARANPVWQMFSDTVQSLVVFQGPQAYISPAWYPGKQQTGKAVPTWNYVVVHAHGFPTVVDDPAWLLQLVSDLSDKHEAAQQMPWKVSDAPADFMQQMLEMIVGIEMPIARMAGKWKLSQNRLRPDRLGAAAALAEQKDPMSQQLAALMMQSLNK